MKKVLIILFCIGIAATACRNKREEERRRLEIERIRQDGEAARLADEQKLMELYLRQRQDSLASSRVSAPRHRAYYVVIGSFRVLENANSFAASMQGTFSNVSIIHRRGWHFVTVGGPYGSRSAAVRMMHSIVGSAGGSAVYAPPPATSGGGSYDEDEEDFSDEEEEEVEVDEEEYSDEEEDTGDDEEEVGAEMSDEEEEDMEEEPAPMPVSTGFSGQAWVMAL